MGRLRETARRGRRQAWLVGLAALLAASAAAEPGRDPSPPVPFPEGAETALALSALPPHLREGATVYTLDPEHGFRIARPGSNGFHAFVARNDPGIYQADWSHDEYADLVIPIAFDEAGARSHMEAYFDLAELRARGAGPLEAQRTLRRRYQRGEYRAPERSGVSYMLSPLLYAYQAASEAPTIGLFSLPHYMFYAPGVTSEDIGAGPTVEHPVMLSDRPGPHGLIIQVVGREERRRIRQEHADLLARLCRHDERLCLPQAEGTG